jgi:hypothetical protein
MGPPPNKMKNEFWYHTLNQWPKNATVYAFNQHLFLSIFRHAALCHKSIVLCSSVIILYFTIKIKYVTVDRTWHLNGKQIGDIKLWRNVL